MAHVAADLSESHDVVLVDTAGFESLTAASAIGMADFVMIPCMPDRGSVREAMRTSQQVASLSKAARRDIPYSLLLTRWKPRGLSERAALDSLRGEGRCWIRCARSRREPSRQPPAARLGASNSKFRFRGWIRWFGSVSGWGDCGTWVASAQGGRMATTVMDWSRCDQSRNTT
jgi:hypothetical protein